MRAMPVSVSCFGAWPPLFFRHGVPSFFSLGGLLSCPLIGGSFGNVQLM